MRSRTHRKTTAEGLRQRIAAKAKYSPPATLTRKQFDRLDDEAQTAYDHARLDYFANGIRLGTPAIRRLRRRATTLLRTHNPNVVGERGLVLTGPPHIGKTTALMKLVEDAHDGAARRNQRFEDEGIVPVAYIEMEPQSTPKSIASSLLTFYGIPHGSRANQHQLTDNALEAMHLHGTQMLIVDELQMLKLDGKIGDDAINSLKTIMNDSGAICVYSGVDLTKELSSRAAEQIMARCQVVDMRPFHGGNEENRSEWADLVTTLGSAMDLLDAEPDHLAPFADTLLGLSDGKIGNLRGILTEALATAQMDRERGGLEVVSGEMLLEIGHVGAA